MSRTLALQDFTDGRPWVPQGPESAEVRIDNQVAGVEMRRLVQIADGRGSLCVLMSDRSGDTYHAPHVYLVTNAARSIRA